MEYDKKYTFSKLELAKVQLEKAIELFLEESDYACSITLAGASEEILGKLLIAKGKKPELKEYATQCAEDLKNILGVELQEKYFATEASFFKNHCKHYIDGKPITISGWAKAYYDKQRALGKSHQATIRALAFKWIRIIFRCWKDKKPYDEAKYLFALKKRNSDLLNV